MTKKSKAVFGARRLAEERAGEPDVRLLHQPAQPVGQLPLVALRLAVARRRLRRRGQVGCVGGWGGCTVECKLRPRSWDSFADATPPGGMGVQGDLEVELPHHHYHTRQQFKRFVRHQQQGFLQPPAPLGVAHADLLEVRVGNAWFGTGPNKIEPLQEAPSNADAQQDERDLQLASPAASCGSSADELESINGAPDPPPAPEPAAFAESQPRPHPPSVSRKRVPRVFIIAGLWQARGRSAAGAAAGQQRSGSQGRLAAHQAAEKRKWSQVAADAAQAVQVVRPTGCALVVNRPNLGRRGRGGGAARLCRAGQPVAAQKVPSGRTRPRSRPRVLRGR